MCCSTKLLLLIKVSCVFREKSVLVVVVVVVKFLYYFFSRACINDGHRWAKKRFFVSLFLFPLFCFFSHTHQYTKNQKNQTEKRQETLLCVIAAFLHFPNEGEDDDDDTTDESI